MAKSINQCYLLGTIGRDVETSHTKGGKTVSKFSLATSRSWKQDEEWKEETDWHNIVLWGNDGLLQHLVKGSRVAVTGRYTNRSYEKDGRKVYVAELVADTVVPLGAHTKAASANNEVSEDDVPF